MPGPGKYGRQLANVSLTSLSVCPSVCLSKSINISSGEAKNKTKQKNTKRSQILLLLSPTGTKEESKNNSLCPEIFPNQMEVKTLDKVNQMTGMTEVIPERQWGAGRSSSCSGPWFSTCRRGPIIPKPQHLLPATCSASSPACSGHLGKGHVCHSRRMAHAAKRS